jgi:hypothetical protein
MIWLGLALSLSGGVADRPDTQMTVATAGSGQVQVADGTVGIPPRRSSLVADGTVGIPPRRSSLVADGTVGIPPRNSSLVADGTVGIPPRNTVSLATTAV